MGPPRFHCATLIPCFHGLRNPKGWSVFPILFTTYRNKCCWFAHVPMLPISLTSYTLKCCGFAQVRPRRIGNIGATRWDNHYKHTKTRFISEPGFDPGTCGLWAHHASTAPLWFHVAMVRDPQGWSVFPISFITYRIKCCWFTHLLVLPISLTSYTLKWSGLAQVPPWHTENIRATPWDNHSEHTHTRCREDFRPQAETRATRTEEQCATLHTYMMYL